MSSRYFTYVPVTMNSFSTLTSAIDLAGSWGQVYLAVPTMTSNVELYIQAAVTAGGDYRRIKHPTINSSTSSANDYAISSQCTNRIVPIPSGFQHIKIEASAIVSFSPTFHVIYGDC